MVGWHHRLHGLEFEQALGDGEGQGSLVYCSPWDCKEMDTNEGLTHTLDPRTDVLVREERGKGR